MILNVKRKVGEINLKSGEFLLPLFEVIINAIHAIEDSNVKGKIKIKILRDETQTKIDTEQNNIFPIKSFIVEDNGIGFNSETFKAFNDAYTEYKLAKGGKGVGRFTVLRAFKKMSIESSFSDKGKKYERSFTFDVDNEIKEIKKPTESNSNKQGSIVTLDSYYPEFIEKTEVPQDFIAERIVEHCLIYYITNSMPQILLEDVSAGKTILLDDVFKNFVFDQKVDNITIENEDFRLFFLKRITNKGKHQILFCAHNRVVEDISVKTIIPNLYKPLKNGHAHFYISIFVTSKYLNSNLNEIRNSFTIPYKTKEKEGDLFAKLSLEEIIEKVKLSIENEYQEHIFNIEKEKISGIRNYILDDGGVEYRHLLDSDEYFYNISPENLSNEKIDQELHRINYELEKHHKTVRYNV